MQRPVVMVLPIYHVDQSVTSRRVLAVSHPIQPKKRQMALHFGSEIVGVRKGSITLYKSVMHRRIPVDDVDDGFGVYAFAGGQRFLDTSLRSSRLENPPKPGRCHGNYTLDIDLVTIQQ
jgi:hypothetical protein